MIVKIRRFIGLLLLVIAGITVWFLSGPGEQEIQTRESEGEFVRSESEVRNVVLISIDTCRADHLGCYGYSRKTTPNIDAIAAEGILFNRAIAPVPITLPSHCSMLTGTIPPYHKVRDNNTYRLSSSNVTLAEILRDNGFVTGAVIGAFVLDSQFDIDQGFDTYEDKLGKKERKTIFSINERKAEEVTHLANIWLQEHCNDKFFLFLHYFDPHSPYRRHSGFRFGLLRSNLNYYDSEIAYTDSHIGRVIKKLRDLNLYDTALLIITGDHGEGLGQHGEQTHGYLIYHSTVHVPLIFKVPAGPKGKRIQDIVGLIDIVPTICGSLGIPVPEQVQGRDLSPYFWNKGYSAEERYLYCESLMATKLNLGPSFGLASDHWKYIHSSKPELYSLEKDTREARNLLGRQAQQASLMRGQLKTILEEHKIKGVAEHKMAMDEETIRRLRSLGYVASGSVDESADINQEAAGPKERIEVINHFEKIFSLMETNKFSKAKRLCHKVLKRWPEMIQIDFFLGRMALAEQDIPTMLRHLNRFTSAVDSGPDNLNLRAKFGNDCATAHTNIGVTLAHEGKVEQAMTHYKKALSYNPYSVIANYNLACNYLKLGKLTEATASYAKTLELKPDFPEAHYYMGNILLKQEKFAKAIAHYNEALRLKPDHRGAEVGRNAAVKQKKNIERTVASRYESLRIDPNQPELHNQQGIYYQREGNVERAIYHWTKALELKPDWPDVLNNLAWLLAVAENPQLRNAAEAIRLAERACELTEFKDPDFLNTLSVAYAAAGKFPKAIETAQRAAETAISSKQFELAEHIQRHIELFRKGQPYREQQE